MSRIAQKWRCADCRSDTFDEYYIVKDDLWEQAVGAKRRKMLCIGCLEERLGRTLKPCDFDDVPLNDIVGQTEMGQYRSIRLRERLGHAAFYSMVDEWRARQPGHPSRSEAIRRLVESALGSRK